MIMIQKPERRENDAPSQFTPGQLVCHRKYGYRGVVVEFDASCSAPDEWYFSNQTQPPRNQPWYHVLVHGSAHTTYAAESSLKADEGCEEILHPLLDAYFDGFLGGRYLRNARPWGT